MAEDYKMPMYIQTKEFKKKLRKDKGEVTIN